MRLTSISAACFLGCLPFMACRTETEPDTGNILRLKASNLLVVSIDTTRADHLSTFGYPRDTSPFLDALASDGHRFSNAQTVMPTTLPSHAAMFTSLYPRDIGTLANGMVIPPTVRTLAERLVEHDFSTAAFVSAAVLDPRFGLGQGFDTYDHPDTPQRRGEETRKQGTDWLEKHAGGRFFCFVHLFDPHTWYTPPESFGALYGVPPGSHPPDRIFVRDPELLTPTACNSAIDAYDAEIRYADAQLGKLLKTLDSLGLRDDTLVVVLSDHGETLDELIERFGYAFDHGEFLYRRELRVPLVLWAPSKMGLLTSSVQDQLVTTLDLMPTVLELLGVPCDEPVQGRSLVPLLTGSALAMQPAFAERRRLTQSEVERPPSPHLSGNEFSVTTQEWHFVQSDGRPDELIDLKSDLLETHNVAYSHPDVVERLKSLINVWRIDGPVGQDQTGGTLDPDLIEELHTLGYLVDTPDNSAPATSPHDSQ